MRWAGRLSNTSGQLPAQSANVINMSLGFKVECPGMQATINELTSKGIIVVAAAGNAGNSIPNYPAAFLNVISVSATNLSDTLADYSSFGNSVDVAAPGGDVKRDLNGDSYPDGVLSNLMGIDVGSSVQQTGYDFLDGTSMASPHVAGVIALMKSVYPALGPAQFNSGLASGALTIDLARNSPAIRDDKYGYGRIDAFKAVQWAKQQNDGGDPNTFITTNSPVLDYSTNIQSEDVLIEKAGSGSMKVTGFSDSQPWISVSNVSTDANGFGRYRVTVNRNGHIDGQYSGWVAFDADNGSRLYVSVLMRVGETAVGEIGWGAALLLDEWTLQNVKQWTGKEESAQLAVKLDDSPPGTYYLMVSTDNDNDYEICDEGELCSIYPNSSTPGPIEIVDGNITLGSFIMSYPSDDFSSSSAASQPENGARPTAPRRLVGKYQPETQH